MKKVFLILLFSCILTSCITTSGFDELYAPYEVENNIVVNDDVCYVYYTNPTTSFLNTLHVVNGAYYYWYVDRYIPVVFPRWDAWRPNRFFYYDRNRWLWKDRTYYDHNKYRREHRYGDFRKPFNKIKQPRINRTNNKPPKRISSPTTRIIRRTTPQNNRPNSSFGTRRSTNNGSRSGGSFGIRR
jgi:hypothetical protein